MPRQSRRGNKHLLDCVTVLHPERIQNITLVINHCIQTWIQISEYWTHWDLVILQQWLCCNHDCDKVLISSSVLPVIPLFSNVWCKIRLRKPAWSSSSFTHISLLFTAWCFDLMSDGLMTKSDYQILPLWYKKIQKATTC